MTYVPNPEISVLLGQTLKDVRQIGNEELLFDFEDGRTLRMYHQQDCCENVYLEDTAGDLDDLIGSPIVEAEAIDGVIPQMERSEWSIPDSETWTFYKIGTAKGFVTLRWYGSSNGYYSESVDLDWVQNA